MFWFAYAMACALVSLLHLKINAQTEQDKFPALVLSDRRYSNSRLLDVKTGNRLEFLIDSKPQDIPLGRLVRWGHDRWLPPNNMVWLADGSFLAGQIQWKTEESFLLVSDWFQPTEWKLDEIRGIILQPIPSAQRFANLEKQMREHSGAADKIWNFRGEQLGGVLTLQLRSAVEGGLPSTRWQLKTGGAVDPIPLENPNLTAIVFSPVLRPEVNSRSPSIQEDRPIRLTMKDASRFSLKSMELSSHGTVLLRTGRGQTFESLDSAQQFASGISRLEGEPPEVSWLSQIEPTRYQRLTEDNDILWPLGRDLDLFGKSLESRYGLISRAIVLHSRSQAAYRLDGRPSKFLAEASLYQPFRYANSSLGSVQCKVLLARDGKLVEVFKSRTLRAADPIVPIEIDLKSAQLLVLIAEEADQGTWGDHLLLRDARIAL